MMFRASKIIRAWPLFCLFDYGPLLVLRKCLSPIFLFFSVTVISEHRNIHNNDVSFNGERAVFKSVCK